MVLKCIHRTGKEVLFWEIYQKLDEPNLYKQITARSKSIYIDKLNEIDDKYNNPFHRKIKMKSVGVKSSTYSQLGVEHNDKSILNSKSTVMLEYQNKKKIAKG